MNNMTYQQKQQNDIAVVTLGEELPLNNNSHINVKKVILAPPSNIDCTLCRGECSGTLAVSGWGSDPIGPVYRRKLQNGRF